MIQLEPDRGQIEQFVDATLRHVAGAGGYISVRSFIENDTKDDKPYRKSPVRLNGDGLQFLIDVAVDDARRAAQDPKPIVFCPPVAVFSDKERARELDLVLGPVLSVEIDADPRGGLARLEGLIGPATVVVKSGGYWTDPDTGEIQDRLHAYWRLAKPACDKDTLAKLKEPASSRPSLPAVTPQTTLSSIRSAGRVRGTARQSRGYVKSRF